MAVRDQAGMREWMNAFGNDGKFGRTEIGLRRGVWSRRSGLPQSHRVNYFGCLFKWEAVGFLQVGC